MLHNHHRHELHMDGVKVVVVVNVDDAEAGENEADGELTRRKSFIPVAV